MHCPRCHRETSDTAGTCVWCGATLGGPDSPPDQSTYKPPAPGGETLQDRPVSDRPVSEWPAADAGRRPLQAKAGHWYLTPWPYAAAVLIAVAVLSFFLLRGNRSGGGEFPELVAGNLPTLLDIYTDT